MNKSSQNSVWNALGIHQILFKTLCFLKIEITIHLKSYFLWANKYFIAGILNINVFEVFLQYMDVSVRVCMYLMNNLILLNERAQITYFAFVFQIHICWPCWVYRYFAYSLHIALLLLVGSFVGLAIWGPCQSLEAVYTLYIHVDWGAVLWTVSLFCSVFLRVSIKPVFLTL